MTTKTTPKRLQGPTFPDRVTLKSIKIHHGLSEETWAYTASVYVDNKRVGEVSNGGQGGPDSLHVADAKAREAVEAAQKQHDPEPYGEDVLFGEMLNEHLRHQDAKKTLRKGYKFAVSAGGYMYGFNDPVNIEPAMVRDGHAEYRVFEA